ncbi:hypothetical protein A4X13_0g4892 [Tilletia indica]|uniref:Uncharacterized protein n=1 Tax=Tilletia indica TaxID=43049 RepID=A0A177TQP9_9BASI|nr:hypothetical protein A4X13_0g4892 [Tilletia indica]
MTSGAGTHAWTIPPFSGVSEDITITEDNLHGAYLNSGRLSEGLARLHGTTFLFKQAATRNENISSTSADSITRVLVAAQEDLRHHLLSVQSKFDDEVDDIRNRLDKELALAHAAMKTRMEQELKHANAAIERKLESTISAVDATLRNAGNTSREGLIEALEVLNSCGSSLQRDINSMESNYMRSLAHIVMGNALSTASTQAMQAVQGSGTDNHIPPPLYVPGGDNQNREPAAGRGRTTTADEHSSTAVQV